MLILIARSKALQIITVLINNINKNIDKYLKISKYRSVLVVCRPYCRYAAETYQAHSDKSTFIKDSIQFSDKYNFLQ